jgi:hypothetical protein
MREDKDNSSQWMIRHHGGAILRVAGVSDFTSWRPAHAALAHPKQLPDGLLEVNFPGRAESVLFVLEVATYPEERMREQAARDAYLVFLDRRVLPEVITLVLHPKGQADLEGDWRRTSLLGTTQAGLRWQVVPLWTLRAEDLLALNDVGVIPWVPLAQTATPVEQLLLTCRERIEQQGRAEEQDNLIAVTQVMTYLRYNDQSLLSLIGGKKMIVETPLIQEILAEDRQKLVLEQLKKKFGEVPPDLVAKVCGLHDAEQLWQILVQLITCADLDAFRALLPA